VEATEGKAFVIVNGWVADLTVATWYHQIDCFWWRMQESSKARVGRDNGHGHGWPTWTRDRTFNATSWHQVQASLFFNFTVVFTTAVTFMHVFFVHGSGVTLGVVFTHVMKVVTRVCFGRREVQMATYEGHGAAEELRAQRAAAAVALGNYAARAAGNLRYDRHVFRNGFFSNQVFFFSVFLSNSRGGFQVTKSRKKTNRARLEK
jgi:hypothetical protein